MAGLASDRSDGLDGDERERAGVLECVLERLANAVGRFGGGGGAQDEAHTEALSVVEDLVLADVEKVGEGARSR